MSNEIHLLALFRVRRRYFVRAKSSGCALRPCCFPACGAVLRCQPELQQLPHRLPERGVAQFRGNLGKRQQDKKPAVQLRMRQHQVLVDQDLIVVEEKVQVKSPVLVALRLIAPHPAEALFQGQKTLQEFQGRQRGLHQAGGVDKPVAADHPHRFAAVRAGQGTQGNPRLAAKGVPCIEHNPQGVAKIRTQADVCGLKQGSGTRQAAVAQREAG